VINNIYGHWHVHYRIHQEKTKKFFHKKIRKFEKSKNNRKGKSKKFAAGGGPGGGSRQ